MLSPRDKLKMIIEENSSKGNVLRGIYEIVLSVLIFGGIFTIVPFVERTDISSDLKYMFILFGTTFIITCGIIILIIIHDWILGRKDGFTFHKRRINESNNFRFRFRKYFKVR